MMTDMEKNFLEFSEMLDQEEHLDRAVLDEDGELLLDLRRALRDEKAEKASLTAREMAARVKGIHQSVAAPTRWNLELQNILRRSVNSRAGVAGTLAVCGLGTAAFLVFGDQFSIILATFFLGALVWLAHDWRSPDMDLPGLHAFGFYGMPLLAMMLTGTLAGLVVGGLGSVSATFRSDADTLIALGWGAGFGIFALLMIALAPSWRAIRDNHGNHKLRLVLHVLLYGLWAAVLLAAATGLGTMNYLTVQRVVLGAVVWVVACLVFVLIAPYTPTGRLDLRQAQRKSRVSLVLGMLPIALCVYVFYQVHLTRELDDEKRYQSVVSEVDSWYQQRMSIPAEQNGWFDIKHFMLKSDIDAGLDNGIGERLRSLGSFHDDLENVSLDGEKWETSKKQFLSELPTIEKALAKPHLSYLVTEAKDGLSFNMVMPNFIVMRDVSKGLAVLTEEAVRNGNSRDALEYAVTGLRWAGRVEDSALIGLMIELAMQEIALDRVQSLLGKGLLDRRQLEELGRALEENRPSDRALYEVMTKEIYMVDRLLKELKTKDFAEIENYGELFDRAGEDMLVALLPKSYIESERLAYLNLELAEVDRWKQLSAPGMHDYQYHVNPLNLAAQIFVPNTARAQVRLTFVLSKIDVNRLRVALEQYRLEEGRYPQALEQLVPGYLEELPRDMMSEAVLERKPGFQYRLKEDGYELISESSSYQILEMPTKQIYDQSSLSEAR